MNKLSISSRLLIAFGSLAMTAAYFLPVWFIFLLAPQYPEGLTMQIWLTRITGQVDIINGLNHYIGMKNISQEMFPEFGYMIYILGAFIVFGLLVALTGSRKLLLGLLVLSLITAGAALYDFYKWGYDYGHNLDPKAAIKVPGLTYQPPVIGHKTLLNFDAYSYPDNGGWVIVGAGAIFFLVYFWDWYSRRRKTRRVIVRKSAAALPLLLPVLFLASCAAKPEPFVAGRDVCSDCSMTVMEPQFGAEIITAKGKIFKFDDAHCVANFIKKEKIAKGDIKQVLFVDYNQPENFVESNNATFVVSPELKSPMSSNAAAFAAKADAEKKAADLKGVIRDWTALQKEL